MEKEPSETPRCTFYKSHRIFLGFKYELRMKYSLKIIFSADITYIGVKAVSCLIKDHCITLNALCTHNMGVYQYNLVHAIRPLHKLYISN